MTHRSKQKTPRKQEKRVIESLLITDLSTEGQGVGRTEDGFVLFVPETVPGDRVTVEVVQEKKRHGFGQVLRLLEASDDRTEPRCEYFGTCGGCTWQHISASAQAHWKGQLLQQILRRVGQIELPEAPVVHTPEQQYGTRTRLRLQVGSRQTLGLFQRGTRRVVPIVECPVVAPCLAEAWSQLRTHLPDLALPLSEVRLLGATEGSVVTSFHMKRNAKLSNQKARKILEQWWRSKQQQLQPLQGVELWQGQHLITEVGHTILKQGEPHALYHPSGFAQASWEGNQLLVEQVVSIWKQEQPRHTLELYAGSGNFSLALAAAGAHVWALDSNTQALQDGQLAARAQQLQQRVRFETFDDYHHSLIHFCGKSDVTFDWLLLDPPRRGLASRILDEIIQLQMPSITYVSCDPGTLARDLKTFLQAGYQLKHLSAVDLMPQTVHIESIACLTRM